MVRYSKLPFRLLLRDYNVDVMYTPMMLAHEFIRSSIARHSDFTTSRLERSPTPDGRGHTLIAQFASSDAEEFARATEMVAPWVDGVNLNCGCPQSWALKEGIGCSLMEDPELVASMVRAARTRLTHAQSVSVKIRIHKELAQTARWIAIVEAAGVDYITVHARLRSQRSSTVPDYAAIRLLKARSKVPVFANGDAYSMADVRKIVSLTEADGVMAARGLLENPALFAEQNAVPVECVQSFLYHAVRCPMPFPLVLHHVHEITAKYRDMGKKEKRRLMACQDLVELVDFVEEKWGLLS